DPPILILDDPFSQVDLLTEERILEGLLPWLEGKTCLLISSRVSSLRGMDRVAVLVEGRIVEEGRPTDLLRQGGVYAGIYRRQQLQRELEGL
ncbi:MAG: ABC transporter ATP-binding protein, partial [Nitrospinae bacterium]|nr:ABC transporter ATP-binding protein [Nitrospinota bacterium]